MEKGPLGALFDLEKDRTQSIDLAREVPGAVFSEDLKTLWADARGGKYQALPLIDRTAEEVLAGRAAQAGKARSRYVLL